MDAVTDRLTRGHGGLGAMAGSRARKKQRLRAEGEGECASVALTQDGSLIRKLREVQNFLLWSLHPDLGVMPQWACIRRKPLVRGALVVFVPHLDDEALRSALAGHITAGACTEPQLLRLPAAHTSNVAEAAAAELLRVPLPRAKKKPTCSGSTAAAAPTPTPLLRRSWPASHVRRFALNHVEMSENGYPDTTGEAPPGYIGPIGDEIEEAGAGAERSRDGSAERGDEGGAAGGASDVAAGADGPAARLIAIDCEMCYAGAP